MLFAIFLCSRLKTSSYGLSVNALLCLDYDNAYINMIQGPQKENVVLDSTNRLDSLFFFLFCFFFFGLAVVMML